MMGPWLKEQMADRALRRVRASIAEQIPSDSSVLELGSGTGSLLRTLAPRIRRGVGIDASLPMVVLARKRAEQDGRHNLHFVHGDALQALAHEREPFDIATATLFIHAIDASQRAEVLLAMRARSKTLWLVDFHPPRSFLRGLPVWVDETLAGHVQHYKSYIRAGCLEKLLPEAGFRVAESRPIAPALTLWNAT